MSEEFKIVYQFKGEALKEFNRLNALDDKAIAAAKKADKKREEAKQALLDFCEKKFKRFKEDQFQLYLDKNNEKGGPAIIEIKDMFKYRMAQFLKRMLNG